MKATVLLRSLWLTSLVGGCVTAFYAAAATPQPAAARPATFDLFTATEATAWNTVSAPDQRSFSAPEVGGAPNCHSIPSTVTHAPTDPQINILSPLLDKPLAAPIDINVQFIAGPTAPIAPDSFKVCYVGFLTIDITKRITDRVAVSAQGIHVTGAQLPHGHHHLVMLIADSQGHLGRSEATFDIQ